MNKNVQLFDRTAICLTFEKGIVLLLHTLLVQAKVNTTFTLLFSKLHVKNIYLFKR